MEIGTTVPAAMSALLHFLLQELCLCINKGIFYEC